MSISLFLILSFSYLILLYSLKLVFNLSSVLLYKLFDINKFSLIPDLFFLKGKLSSSIFVSFFPKFL